MRFLIIFIFLVSNSFADEVTDIKNLIINKELKKYDGLTFFDNKNKQLNLSDYEGSLILLNFWATWCLPCKEEMPSLDLLQVNENFNNLKIFPINVGNDNVEKTSKFFKELNIQNLNIYFNSSINLVKKLKLK